MPCCRTTYESICHPDHMKITKLQTEDYISTTSLLNDIKFGRVVKMPLSITFQKSEPVAPNLHNTVFDGVI